MSMASRYQNKAWIVVEAWKRVFGETPTKEQVIGVMLPAEVETALGDASEAKGNDPNQRTWRGEINWGALQKTRAQGGLLTTEERSAVLSGGGTLTPKNESDVEKARLLTYGKGLRWIGMHRDSAYNKETKVNDPYLVFFWAHDNHIDAASEYLRALKNMFLGEKTTKSMGAMGTHELATVMYDNKYYSGFKPREEAIKEYSDRMSGAKGEISSALTSWDPTNPVHDEGSEKGKVPFPTSPTGILEPTKGGAPFPVATFRPDSDSSVRGDSASKEEVSITRNRAKESWADWTPGEVEKELQPWPSRKSNIAVPIVVFIVMLSGAVSLIVNCLKG